MSQDPGAPPISMSVDDSILREAVSAYQRALIEQANLMAEAAVQRTKERHGQH